MICQCGRPGCHAAWRPGCHAAWLSGVFHDRLARAVALAYRLPEPATPEQLLAISENWKPYRTWVTLLMRTQLEYETGEITGRRPHARTR